MQTIIIKPAIAYQSFSPEQLMELILKDIYPQLFEFINGSIQKINTYAVAHTDPELAILAQKAWDQTDELYRKEKLLVFPYLLVLIKEKRKSEHCNIFTNIRQLHIVLNAVVAQLHAALKSDTWITETEKIQLFDQLTAFDTQLRIMKMVKDRYLFQPLKGCSACRLKKAVF